MNNNIKKMIAFGGGEAFRKWVRKIDHDIQVVAVADNGFENRGNVCGFPVIDPAKIADYVYDRIVITIDSIVNEKAVFAIYNQLLSIGVPEDKIVLMPGAGALIPDTAYDTYAPALFIKKLAEIMRQDGILGETAECGVFRGDVACYINEYFPDAKLHLFDTFGGFDERDVEKEEAGNQGVKVFLKMESDFYLNGNEEIARLKCPNRANVVIHKGRVPDTFSELSGNEKFAFVRLDMDLYAPQLAALEYFAPRMVDGGVIILHDYFYRELGCLHPTLGESNKRAVDEFKRKGHRKFKQFPAEDISMGLLF